MSFSQDRFEQSLRAGFIDQRLSAANEYLPQFLANDKSQGKKVLSSIIQGLNNCEEFWFSVAFVTTSGVAALIETLLALQQKGIKGKILVSQYLNFTQPEALKRLLKLKNLEVKIAIAQNFHSKGYLFRRERTFDLIVGSSNLTASALCSNIEWNLKVSATPESYIISNAIHHFETEYKNAVLVNAEFIAEYAEQYKRHNNLRNIWRQEVNTSTNTSIVPNSMQVEALRSLEGLRVLGKKKALIISATGTGKTYLSAFDAQRNDAKKLLFVVHRLNIAKASMEAYRRIFGNTRTYGLYSGDVREEDADFVFSTVQTISRHDHLMRFSPAYFDYIVIDETHRAAADSYKNIMGYFNPRFMLGMTATPERTDGQDVFQLFDHIIGYEIRLHRALEENILSPFHYYGITDISVNGKVLDEDADIRVLTADERINRIIEKAQLYGTDNGMVKGLIFCSSVQESNALSAGFNERGLKTVALSSMNSEAERAEAISKLERDEGGLDYIFSVDIFNEGVDIPGVNQVIMLRPTESAIIFVQQLGRGLRKVENKEYLTVIDFIGNYKKNFLVPVALYGDTTYNKDTLRKLITSGSSLIPGTSTINFDRITKEKIFEAIDQANMQLRRDLINDYNLLKYKIGRSPMMTDFLEHGSRDPFLFVSNSKSYFNFVASVEEEYTAKISPLEASLLQFLSLEVNNAKRVEESLILQQLIRKGRSTVEEIKELIIKDFGYDASDDTIESCIRVLNGDFFGKSRAVVEQTSNGIFCGNELKEALLNTVFRDFLQDSVDYSIRTFRTSFRLDRFNNGFLYYCKYSRKDVCRILNWPKDISSTVYGYRTLERKTPMFVTYHKSNDISETTNYNDYFIDHSTFAWESRSNRRVDSEEIKKVIHSSRIMLFVKKEDAEGSDFYYVDDVKILADSVEQALMSDSTTPVVRFKFRLQHPVEESLYDYLTSTREKPIIAEYENDTEGNTFIEEPFQRMPAEMAIPFKNCLPLYDTKMAASDFLIALASNEVQWVSLKKQFKYSEDYFVCQVIGESMNKVIPNGSWCLFRRDPGGSRNGKVVLVERSDAQDRDFGRGYTVKHYQSKKIFEDGRARNVEVILSPFSTDKTYYDIVLKGIENVDYRVVGIFVEVL
jgi:superfamily II DNA or RNA helicase